MSENFEKLFTEFSEVSTQEWKDKIIKDLKGLEYNKLIDKTEFGSEFEPFYRKEDIDKTPFIDNIPGKYPFVRGTEKSNDWLIRQDIIVNDIVEANNIAIKLINTGVESICYCFNDRHVSEMADLTMLLEGIDLLKIEISFKNQDKIFVLQELFILYLEMNSIDIHKVKGSFNYSPYHDLLLYGEFHDGETPELKELSEFIDINKERLGKYGATSVCANIFKNAGATIPQEIAFALSQAVEYINKYTDFKHASAGEIIERMEFTFATGADYFFEIAKYRVIRMLWAKIVKEFEIEDEKLQKIRINAVNTSWDKTIYDAHVNMLRVTTQTMSSALGGCKTISVAPFDKTFKTPDDFSYRIAKNTQIILKEESYFDKIVDPAGGSYYIEKITQEIAEKALDLFLDIENSGGFYENIINGKIQTMIEEAANDKNIKIAQGRISILGTNKYPNQEENASDKIKLDLEYNYDIINPEFKVLHIHRGSEAFEKLRLKTEEAFNTPKVFLYSAGNLTMRKARAMFSSNFFACAGFDIVDDAELETEEEKFAEIKKQKPDIIVACSSDKEYVDLVPKLKEKLKHGEKIVVAGYPKDLIEQFKEIGVTDFIHAKSNILEVLTNFQDEIL